MTLVTGGLQGFPRHCGPDRLCGAQTTLLVAAHPAEWNGDIAVTMDADDASRESGHTNSGAQSPLLPRCGHAFVGTKKEEEGNVV